MAGPTILDESKVQLATDRKSGSIFATNNIKIHLWVGAGSPDHTAVRAGLIADSPTFTGYAPQQVTSWGTPVLDAAFKAIIIGSTVTFTNGSGSSSGSILGWWFEDNLNGKALLFGKFATPVTIPAGQSFTFTPVWTGTGENLTS